jgi:hypothetical protein
MLDLSSSLQGARRSPGLPGSLKLHGRQPRVEKCSTVSYINVYLWYNAQLMSHKRQANDLQDGGLARRGLDGEQLAVDWLAHVPNN